MRPDWREIAKKEEATRGTPRGRDADKAEVDRIIASRREAVALDETELPPDLGDADQVFIKRTTPVFRGKWPMVSEEVEKADRSELDE